MPNPESAKVAGGFACIAECGLRNADSWKGTSYETRRQHKPQFVQFVRLVQFVDLLLLEAAWRSSKPTRKRKRKRLTMELFEIIAVLITLAAVFRYLNYKLLRMPQTIALMLMSLLVAGVVLLLQQVGGPLDAALGQPLREMVGEIPFDKVLLEGILSLLLFAGALHVNLDDLARSKWSVGVFATAGVIGSTFAVAGMTLGLSHVLDLKLHWIHCLLFGALISPTDPIAVLGIMKSAGAPKSLETKIAGESLFNDGIGVVVFLSLLGIAGGDHPASPAGILQLFAVEAVGGVVLGLALGYAAYRILKGVDNYHVEILITLALVFGGYALAGALHTSGPLAMVAAGLLIGNHGRRLAMSAHTREHLDTFWEVVDEVLNAVLFVLIGLEVLVLTLSGRYLLAGCIAVPMVLLARLVTVSIPVAVLSLRREFAPRAILILTWGGLRGGISVAMALSLANVIEDTSAGPIITMAYVVVAFSILVQGLTIKRLVAAGRTM